MLKNLKTGTWVNLNSKRIFLTLIGTKELEGIEHNNGSLKPVNLTYTDIKSAGPSKAPMNIATKSSVPRNTPFGYLTWDTHIGRVQSISFIEEGKLNNIAI